MKQQNEEKLATELDGDSADNNSTQSDTIRQIRQQRISISLMLFAELQLSRCECHAL